MDFIVGFSAFILLYAAIFVKAYSEKRKKKGEFFYLTNSYDGVRRKKFRVPILFHSIHA